MPQPLFVLATRGLESLAAAELAAVPGATVTEIAYRRVAATAADLAPLLRLRTVDDCYLALGQWPGIGRPRVALAALGERASALDLRGAAAACGTVREVASSPSFSVSASFVGKRNYGVEEIKAAVAAPIARRHGWTISERDDAATLNLRLLIEHEVAHVGLRLAQRPLHERPWKRMHQPGSLRPSVAAAMLAACGAQRGMRLLDPCCGGGTVLIEAALGGLSASGGDVDDEALVAARANAADAGVAIDVQRWDATALTVPTGSIARVVCNPPWDRQAAPSIELTRFYAALCAEIARVLEPGGRVALLTTWPQLVQIPGRRVVSATEISLQGQRPTLVVCE